MCPGVDSGVPGISPGVKAACQENPIIIIIIIIIYN